MLLDRTDGTATPFTTHSTTTTSIRTTDDPGLDNFMN
jgi:hypothetical protein